MNKPDLVDAEKHLNRTGLIHIAFSVGSKERVDEITQLLQTDGYHIVSGPRTTGDGYYESCVVAADLGAAGSGVEADLSLRVLGESDLKPFYYLSKSVCVSLCFVGITAVDLDHAPVQSAALQFCKKCASVFHNV